MLRLFAVSFGNLKGDFFVVLVSAENEASAFDKASSYIRDFESFEFQNVLEVKN